MRPASQKRMAADQVRARLRDCHWPSQLWDHFTKYLYKAGLCTQVQLERVLERTIREQGLEQLKRKRGTAVMSPRWEQRWKHQLPSACFSRGEEEPAAQLYAQEPAGAVWRLVLRSSGGMQSEEGRLVKIWARGWAWQYTPATSELQRLLINTQCAQNACSPLCTNTVLWQVQDAQRSWVLDGVIHPFELSHKDEQRLGGQCSKDVGWTGFLLQL